MAGKDNIMDKIISLCKRRGFIYQGSEIYGGLAGTWDYGPLGVAFKKNVENLWWKRFVLDREDIYPIDAAILMNQNVWKASGHVDGFSDPLVEDIKTKKRYRADHLLEASGISAKGLKLSDINSKIQELKLKSPDGNPLGEVKQFNMMLKTHIGATEDSSAISYLRPETAGGMFVNFKNVLDSFHPKLPFGLAQIGKAFRNEIAPRDFLFRVREIEQMEIEYFIDPKSWEKIFDDFTEQLVEYSKDLGLDQKKVHKLEVAPEDRAHYSKRTIDFEFDYPFGREELWGLAYRTNFDLSAHSKASKAPLEYFDEETKEKLIPHVIEPSLGVGRTMLAILTDAYREDELGGEAREYLKLSPKVAPVILAVFPLMKNRPELVKRAREIYLDLRKKIKSINPHLSGQIVYDETGSIGKRYRRQDEIGTPFCLTIDFDTIEKDGSVTIRDRDTGQQERVKPEDLEKFLEKKLN